MNEILLSLGVEGWKPVITALLMPPVPLFLLVLAGTWFVARRRWLLGWLLVLLSVVAMWFLCTGALSHVLRLGLLKPPPALTEQQVAELKRAPRTAIIVLGGGRRVFAPEYGLSSLNERSIDRLRYGAWLARETGLPLGFSGGVGHGGEPGPSEAEIAERIAKDEFARPLKFAEIQSRDTRENAVRTLAMLEPQGVDRVVIVTHGYHMPRALANFERAAAGKPWRFLAAPMGMHPAGRLRATDWLPTGQGFLDNRILLHEIVGKLIGA
jgi:uncharacterized SAM-binding protein YcdF (DUF218 family)